MSCLLGTDLRPVDISAVVLRTVELIDYVECVDIDSTNKAYWLELQCYKEIHFSVFMI